MKAQLPCSELADGGPRAGCIRLKKQMTMAAILCIINLSSLAESF